MGKIEMDYHNACAQAKKLRNAANDIDRIMNGTYSNTISDTSAAWKGDNATRFLGKADEAKKKMKDTAKQIRELADAIERAAKKVYEAEKKAEEIARQRSFGGGSGKGGSFSGSGGSHSF